MRRMNSKDISGKNSAKSNARLLFVVHVSSERGIGYAGTRGVNEIRGEQSGGTSVKRAQPTIQMRDTK